MRIHQYCCFALESTTVPASDLTAWLGVPPDETHELGSWTAAANVPPCHAWLLIERGADPVDRQIHALIRRMNPIRSQLISLCSDHAVLPVLRIVRYFQGDPAGIAPRGFDEPLPKAWHLSTPVLEFLVSTGTELEVEEYAVTDQDFAR
ncbi:DUF4279 domain-containing protein [Nocardia sp. NPDC056100]|uniref:DUF4279 domain-containing protein n=1 Tax=Nocardia sp. NPDC056100 TaxID=3345712 RepID=UPI0035DBA097